MLDYSCWAFIFRFCTKGYNIRWNKMKINEICLHCNFFRSGQELEGATWPPRMYQDWPDLALDPLPSNVLHTFPDGIAHEVAGKIVAELAAGRSGNEPRWGLRGFREVFGRAFVTDFCRIFFLLSSLCRNLIGALSRRKSWKKSK